MARRSQRREKPRSGACGFPATWAAPDSSILGWPQARHIPDTGESAECRTDYSYGVGRLLFWALYRRLGPQTWRDVLGGYFRTYRPQGSTSEQFVRFVVDHASPDVTEIFEDWLLSARWAQRLAAGAPVGEVAR